VERSNVGMFQSKQKVSIEECCREFYESNIFKADFRSTDVFRNYLDTAVKLIREIAPSFKEIDAKVFQREAIALKIELFALAWMHKLGKEKYTLPQAVYTKRYLQERGQSDIWEIMTHYNEAIAISIKEVVMGERSKNTWIGWMNDLKSSQFEKWVKAGVDPECAARVCGREGTEVIWKRNITVNSLSARLADRIGCNENLKNKSIEKLADIIRSFYNDAKEYINSANIQVSRG
jgi:hypothetical protein